MKFKLTHYPILQDLTRIPLKAPGSPIDGASCPRASSWHRGSLRASPKKLTRAREQVSGKGGYEYRPHPPSPSGWGSSGPGASPTVRWARVFCDGAGGPFEGGVDGRERIEWKGREWRKAKAQD